VASALEALGETQRMLSKNPAALASLEEALALRRRLQPDRPALQAAVINGIGEVHRAMGDFDLALTCFEEDLRITSAELGAEHPSVGSVKQRMAKVFLAQRHLPEARKLLEEAAAIHRAAPGARTSYATDLNELGRLCDAEGDLPGALRHYEEALGVYRAAFGGDHYTVATALNNMGVVQKRLGNHAVALKNYEESLRIKRLTLGSDHHEVGATLVNIGAVCAAQNQQRAARSAFEEARKILAARLGKDHPTTQTAEAWLKELKA
jgi:tetratricopeptide (TPR) repeat protein